jgi:hypothetical protein
MRRFFLWNELGQYQIQAIARWDSCNLGMLQEKCLDVGLAQGWACFNLLDKARTLRGKGFSLWCVLKYRIYDTFKLLPRNRTLKTLYCKAFGSPGDRLT